MQREMTSRQMADALAPSPSQEDRAKAMRRIQFWTSEELIDPVSMRHSGRGSVRRYSPASLLEAAVLRELAERNISVEQMRHALAAIRFSRADREPDPFLIALGGSRRVLVFVNPSLSTGPVVRAELDPEEPRVPDNWTIGLWIDLTVTFARLRPHFLLEAAG